LSDDSILASSVHVKLADTEYCRAVAWSLNGQDQRAPGYMLPL